MICNQNPGKVREFHLWSPSMQSFHHLANDIWARTKCLINYILFRISCAKLFFLNLICFYVLHNGRHMKACITINQTKWYYSGIWMLKSCKNQTRFTFVMLSSEWLSLVICRQRADHFTPTSSGDGSTTSGEYSTIWIASNTLKMAWYKIAFHWKLITNTCTPFQWRDAPHSQLDAGTTT